jgi:hypothetical protein
MVLDHQNEMRNSNRQESGGPIGEVGRSGVPVPA